MAFLLILSATTGCKNKIDTTNSSKAVTTLACEAQQYSVNLTGRLSSSLDPLLLSQVGFLVSTSEGVNADNAEYTFPAVLYDRDFGVSVPIGSLGNQRGVRFYFVAFATDADKTYLGKVQSFQFPDIEVTGLNLTPLHGRNRSRQDRPALCLRYSPRRHGPDRHMEQFRQEHCLREQ